MHSNNEIPVVEDALVAVDGCSLHVRRGGVAGTLPAVVLESGGGSTIQTWNHIEQALLPHTAVLSYERAGVGTSSGRASSGVSAAAVTQRLAALMHVSGTPTPAILVGHSLGGLYMHYFAAKNPELVVGLVLLDATPQDMPLPRFFTWKPTVLMWLLHGVARIGLLQWLAKRVLPAGSPALPQNYINAIARFQHVSSVLREIRSLAAIQAEVAALAPVSLPILSISAGTHPPAVTPEQIASFRKSHEQLAAAGLPPYSRHVRVEAANHMSLLTDPQHAATVAAQILEFSEQISRSPRP